MWTLSFLREIFRVERNVHPTAVIENEGQLAKCGISSNGEELLSVSSQKSGPKKESSSRSSGNLMIDAANANVRYRFGSESSRFRCCAISPKENVFVTGDYYGTVSFWKSSNGEQCQSFPAHDGKVSAIAFSQSTNTMASAGFCDKTVRLWDFAAESVRQSAVCTEGCIIRAINLSADSRMVYVGGSDKVVRAWDINSGKEAFTLKGHKNIVSGCSVSANGVLAVSCSNDGTVILWDTRKLTHCAKNEFEHEMYSCSMTPYGYRAVACGFRGNAVLFDTCKPTELTYFNCADDTLSCCGISDAGDRVVTTSTNGLLRLYNLPFIAVSTDEKNVPSDSLGNSYNSVHNIEVEKCSHSPDIEAIYLLALQNSHARMRSVYSSLVDRKNELTTRRLVEAVRNENCGTNISSLIDVGRVHIVLRTMLAHGISCSDDEFVRYLGKKSFLYDYIYSRLSVVVQSEHEKEFAVRLLDDAVQYGILMSSDRNIIYGDIQVMQGAISRFNSLEDILAEMYSSVSQRLLDVEADLTSTIDALQELKMERNRERRIAMKTGWAKLGLSLIPVAGPVAMSIAGIHGELLLSFSPKDIIDMCTGLLGGLTDVAVEFFNKNGEKYPKGTRGKSTFEEQESAISTVYSVRLVEVVLSDSFLERLSTSDRETLVRTLVKHYGMSLQGMRQDATDAFEMLAMAERNLAFDDSQVVSHLESSQSVKSGHYGKSQREKHVECCELYVERPWKEEVGITGEFASANEDNLLGSNDEDSLSDGEKSEEQAIAHESYSIEHKMRIEIVESLKVDQVANLFSIYVCESLDDERSGELRPKIRENVRETGISGRGVISSDIRAELVARAALYGHRQDGIHHETDFKYLELVVFVRKLRSGKIDIQRFEDLKREDLE